MSMMIAGKAPTCPECDRVMQADLPTRTWVCERGHPLVFRPFDDDRPRPDGPKRSPHQNVMLGVPDDAGQRKERPIATGVLDYFPAAMAEVARLSKVGNDQHNPGQPLHWARGKSADHADCIVRHLIQRGTVDSDGIRHAAKMAWRALALLQSELEAAAGFEPEET